MGLKKEISMEKKKKTLIWWLSLIVFIAIIVVFLIAGCDYKFIDELEHKNSWVKEVSENAPASLSVDISDNGEVVTLIFDGNEPIKITEDTDGTLFPIYQRIYGVFNKSEDGSEITSVAIYAIGARGDVNGQILVQIHRQ